MFKFNQIQKLYVSNFLTGLVFWYGIEKLFMQSIGIDPIGIAVVSTAFLITLVVADIPSGILADKWSRKGVLVVSAVSLMASSYIGGISNGLAAYVVAVILYGFYVVTTSGTYTAIIYDSLHEENRADQYNKINGRIFACFLVGAAAADFVSGFIAHVYGYRSPYLLSMIPCLLNIIVMLSLHEPNFHRSMGKQKILHQIGRVSRELLQNQTVRTLVIVSSFFIVIELYMLDFGQLYIMRYIPDAKALGILWGVYALAMALGSVISHKFHTKLHVLILGAVIPFIAMSFLDNAFGIVLFMIAAVATQALMNQVNATIQDNTPSSVRASILSVVSTFGRVISIPMSFLFGYLIRNYNAFTTVRYVAVIALGAFVYWLFVMQRVRQTLKVEGNVI